MTIPSTPRKAGPLLGNGVQTSWPFTFKVFADTDILVTVADNLGIETPLTLTSDYVVTLNPNQETSPGGTVTYLLPEDYTLVITGDIDYDQPLDLPSGGAFSPTALENELDRLTMQIQQLREAVNRAVQAPITSNASGYLPPPQSNALIGWNESETAMQNFPLSEIATAIAFATYRYDTYTGDGTTTSFVLSADPVTLGNIDVSVDGQTYVPGVDHTLVGQNLVFTVAPTNGVEILARYGQGMASGVSGDALDISYQPTGVGSVLTDVQTKLREDKALTDYTLVSQGPTAASNHVLGVPVGTHLLSDIQLSGTSLEGKGQGSILKANGTTTALRLGYTNTPSQWTFKSISKVAIDGNAKASDGVTFADSSSTQVSGRWVIEKAVLTDCKKAVYKASGNIGNTLRDVAMTGNDYGYYAEASSSPLMHGGCDTLERVHIDSSTLAAVYIDSSVTGTGGTKLVDTVIEVNPGFGVFVKNWAAGYTPLTLDNVWFEGNATSASVTINGTPYTPVDLYLENAAHVVLINGIVPETKLVNSHLSVRDSFLTRDLTTWDIDSSSTVIAEGVRIDGGLHPVKITSVAAAPRPLGNFAPVFYGHPRGAVSSNSSNVLYAQSFDNANTYTFTGTTTVTATRVADGVIFESCAEGVFPVSTTEQSTAWTLTLNKWYVFTMDVKHVSGTLSDLSMDLAGGTAMAPAFASLLSTGKWVTVATIGKCTSGGTARLRVVNGSIGSQTIRFSALQVIEFDTEADALAYYNGGEYRAGSSRPRVTYSTVAPTTGTWAVGDRCINTVATVGQPKSWVCTVAGTPGTWVSEGNL